MAMKFTFLFLNLGKIQILYLKVPEGGGGLGSAGLGIIPKKQFFSASLSMDWFVDAFLSLRQNAARIDMKIEGR